jgi:hypothetical protein
MQGLVYSQADFISLGDKLGFQVNKSGNRRLIEPLGEGIAHCALFHESVLPTNNNMRVLLAKDEKEAFIRFQQFLENACPLPRLLSLASDDCLERQMFDAFKATDVISPATVIAGDKVAYSIDTERLFKEDYALLRETMIETLRRFYNERESLLNEREAVETTRSQKAKEKPSFYRSFLKNAPKIRATERESYKRIVAKWFSPSMTWYAVEYDPNDGTLFGYVKNEGYPDGSEWGYFSIQEIESFRNQYPRYYIERDLHMGDRWIDVGGKLYDAIPKEAKAA